MQNFKQQDVNEHNHDFTEIVIINSGTATHFNNEESYRLKKGDSYVLSGETSHGYKEINQLDLTNILYDENKIILPEWDIKKISGYHALFKLEPHYRRTHSIKSNLTLTPIELIHIDSLVKNLQLELEHKNEGYQFASVAILMQIISFLSRSYTNKNKNTHHSIQKIAKVLSYLEINYSKKITQEQIAQVANLSKSSLQREFLKAFNQSAIDYLIKLRLSKAYEKIKNNQGNITEIALASGFSDSNYFSRKFREVFNQTPTECKHSFKNK